MFYGHWSRRLRKSFDRRFCIHQTIADRRVRVALPDLPVTSIPSTLNLMKLPLFSTSVLLLAATVLTSRAQEPQDENKNTNRRNLKGYHEREANARTALNQAVSELTNNPQGLFDRLDHDGNGELSKEEFERIVNIGVQGAAAIEGTKGVSATGASGATGITGATAISGQATMPGHAPATYGQQPGLTGQTPAAGQTPTNTPRDAAAAGQQPIVPGQAQGQNNKPAPGQPVPATPPTAPVTKDPQ